MNRPRPWATVLLVLLPLGPPPLVAQVTPPLERALAPLAAPGRLVRIRTDGARVTGRLLAAGRGAMTLDTGSGSRIIALETIDSVWVRGRAVGTGAIVGGATGMVVLGTFFGFLLAAVCEVDCDGAALQGALAGGAVGLGAGALVGAGIGALIPKWKRRFP
ncbi:MAG TPA: hypothetical protein VLL51_07285 [Gemmatimonadales bacterium]|nr:hypothetical protein [Gemmatimonadales bacterium]